MEGVHYQSLESGM
ncbi:hypothetical protein LINPERPRIM_LOCUS29941 [Linum perenne]